MSNLPSLPGDATFASIAETFPEPFARLHDYGAALMYGPSPLPHGKRELLAALVSLLNGCRYCHGTHLEVARRHGVDAALLEHLDSNPQTLSLDPEWQCLLGFARKLTEAPGAIRRSDIAELLALGWSEEAVVHATQIIAYFCMLNRVVSALGIEADAAYFKAAGARLAAEARRAWPTPSTSTEPDTRA